jgi:P-type conjugative transfer protein TrbJ
MDIANLIQDILQVINEIEQIDHEVESLSNEAQSLENEANNLKHLDFNISSRLNQTTARIDQLMHQAQGLAYNVSQTLNDFQHLYPASYPSTVSNAQLTVDAVNRWNTSLAALQTAVQTQSQAVANFQEDESAVNDLLSKSQSAEGALQATQVTNQLLGLTAHQLIQEQQLRIAQDRAAALEQARALAADERARAVRKKFMTLATPYTPADVSF